MLICKARVRVSVFSSVNICNASMPLAAPIRPVETQPSAATIRPIKAYWAAVFFFLAMLAPSPNFNCGGADEQAQRSQTYIINNISQIDRANVHGLGEMRGKAKIVEHLSALLKDSRWQADHEPQEEEQS